MIAEVQKHTSVTETTVTTTTTTITTTETTIIEVKERLAKLYSANTSTVSKAEIIYYESWDKAKCKHGYAHEETLSCLSELALFLGSQSTKACARTAIETLQGTIVEIVTKEKDTQKLFYSGETIARLYATLSLKETAFELLKEIRRQLAFTEVKPSKNFKFQLRHGYTIDRRSFVFVMAFEETLKGNSRPTLFTEIMSDLMTETTLYESWMRSQKYNSSFEVTLGIGARLSQFLKTHNCSDESSKITDELWELFLAEIGTGESTKRSGILWELFLVCVTEMSVEDHDLTVISAGANLVLSRYEAGAFEGSFELATWSYKYMKSHEGFTLQENLAVGFKLALCMAGRHSGTRHCQDQKLSQRMMELSKSMLKECLKASEQEGMSITSMKLEELSLIASLLGEQRDYENLERILNSLWQARQLSWGYKIIAQIGLRLADARAAHGRPQLATELLQDMSYNLQRVRTILDPLTLTCYNHLSSIYTFAKQPDKAMAVHGTVIKSALADENNSGHPGRTAKVVQGQLQLLKRSYQRSGKWEQHEHGEAGYYSLWNESKILFEDSPYWNKGDDIRKWPTKGVLTGHKDLGWWHAPSEWGFLQPEKRFSNGGVYGASVRNSTN
ncbi:hypothetical protein FGG08_002902 [Glutinoglossum americanum]|uniref:Uncharacterized protein n=1 Tax=Glutinoglossum americanum TaxID=1670608 RepID=A0A9P8I8F7_9PEZI|nr:hypothetical protein FGG08_002902 [Glutinoglossum americanum]